MEDEYYLKRFIDAHEKNYQKALQEIKAGRKLSHWMWYIFPQLSVLGRSSTAKYYGISGESEAKAFINNEILRNHLLEIAEELYKLDDDIFYIFGYPDYLKLKSCMTLFDYIDPTISIFSKILNKFYNGERDQVTLKVLKVKANR